MTKEPETAVEDTTEDPSTEGSAEAAAPTADGIGDAMSEEQIRAAGLKIDLPYDAPPAKPQRLKYAVGAGEGWTPPEGFTIAGVPYAEYVAGMGGGAKPQQEPTPPPTPDPAVGQSAQTTEPG